ncbi:lebercilin [Spea bombifrons]|uniref:lebercilin n=1 Tax=Spea bombifrons TaxID=233779 RepID=UPI00234B21FD|nr:lebercilin [Spea bombifrons]
MNPNSPYSQYAKGYKEAEGPLSPGRGETTSTQSYISKKRKPGKMKGNQDVAAGERGRTRSRRYSDTEKDSESYFSEDFDNTTYESDRSPTPSSKSRSPRVKKADQKMIASTPMHNGGSRKPASKFPSSKKGPRWGFRSQSLNKDSPPKDMDLVTKRVLSARLLKINELRNELTEHQIKLDELQKENKILKRLQCRQEKALNKFEDTENEISQLLSRHNNEIRTLRERLRKSQERERAVEKKLKDTEDELYRTNTALKKLKHLSEDRHLAEREELTRKVDVLESRLDERERRVKDLEKNIELTQSSLQRQLQSEKKKAHDAQEQNRLLQEELQRLMLKLKEKERELDVKNIYAYRLSKPSPKKDTEITPRRKGANQNISTGVQTADNTLQIDLFPSPPPPPPPVFTDEVENNQQVALQMDQDNLEKLLREEAEKLKEKERAERKRELEEKQRKETEQKMLEEKARKLREEWEREESERKRKENFIYEDKTGKDVNTSAIDDERRRKELLLAKMFEIDKESQDVFVSGPTSSPPKQVSKSSSDLKPDMVETKHKTYRFTEPTQKLFNGLPVHGGRDAPSKTEAPGRKNEQKNTDFTSDFTFGSYAPSFGKGRSPASDQKSENLEDPVLLSNTKLNIQKDKKSHLMEQLFGSGASTALPSISKTTNSGGFSSAVAQPDKESDNAFPWENSKGKRKDDAFLTVDGKIANSSRHRSPHAGKPLVKAVEYLEDEIEEVAL